MNECSRRVLTSSIAIAIAALLVSRSSPALATAPAINAGPLRMSGMALDPLTVSAGPLRMTGMFVDPTAVSAGPLRMTGVAPDRSAIPPSVLQPHKR